MIELFWADPRTIRYGVALYGSTHRSIPSRARGARRRAKSNYNTDGDYDLWARVRHNQMLRRSLHYCRNGGAWPVNGFSVYLLKLIGALLVRKRME